MLAHNALQGIIIIGLISTLFALGFAVTLKSGVASLSTSEGLRQAGSNLSQAMLRLGAFGFGIVLLHAMLGIRIGLPW